MAPPPPAPSAQPGGLTINGEGSGGRGGAHGVGARGERGRRERCPQQPLLTSQLGIPPRVPVHPWELWQAKRRRSRTIFRKG